MIRLEFLIEGEWLAPNDPPPGYTIDPIQTYEFSAFDCATAIEFDHPDLGRLKAVPRHYPCRLAEL